MKLDYTIDNELMIEAVKFIQTCYAELGKTKTEAIYRIDEVKEEINQTGTYTHLPFELEHGARMAWRNNNRCIGRLLWHTLHVFDARHVQTAEEAFTTLKEHIAFATNEGKIRSAITIFPQRKDGKDPLRIWNHQLIRYAGYEIDGRLVGDGASLSFTKTCQALGWQGAGTNFDILPLVIQEEGAPPQLFPLPSSLIKEVPITHPSLTEVAKLQMKWYGVPIIADMRLEIGGIDYAMAPFNGWYMGTEIGARNLADEDRYNLLPHFATFMGLDTRTNRSLWIDQALVELNIAVIHSFEKAGVTLVDHHTAAKQFQKFEEQERKAGRDITGNWTWLLPPISPAATHIYHRPYKNDIVSPNYFYQETLTLEKNT